MQVGDLVQSKDYFYFGGEKKCGIVIKGPYPYGMITPLSKKSGTNTYYTVLWGNGKIEMLRAKEVNIISESG